MQNESAYDLITQIDSIRHGDYKNNAFSRVRYVVVENWTVIMIMISDPIVGTYLRPMEYRLETWSTLNHFQVALQIAHTASSHYSGYILFARVVVAGPCSPVL
jgi:hypothetical protein